MTEATFPASLPNLRGVVIETDVSKIGSGSYSKDYVNWARTLDLAREHIPEWTPYLDWNHNNTEHPHLFKSPIGAYLMVGWMHVPTAFRLPAVPQAIMDHKNNAIPYDKIDSRDISDTERRGACMAACHHFGLAVELWGRLPFENGFSRDMEAQSGKPGTMASPSGKAAVEAVKASEKDFQDKALAVGLSTFAIEGITAKLNGDWEKGINTLKTKTEDQINALNKQFEPKKTRSKASAESY